MSALLPAFEYDIFISYRHNDNRSGWVADFVNALQDELAATVKDSVSIYFDTNLHDGLHDHHEVDESLKRKLKALILIPIVSRTYCDTNSFAWNHEFKVFIEQASMDTIGAKVNVAGGNVANRVLPIRIHELKPEDVNLFESEMGGKMRAIDFIYKESGVNRPLLLADQRNDNQVKIDYRNQINKVANAIDEVLTGIKAKADHDNSSSTSIEEIKSIPFKKELKRRNIIRASLVYILFALLLWKVTNISADILHLTESTIRLVTLALVILFPISILMAWLYERSPHGFIRTGSIESLKNPFSDEQKKPLTSNTFIGLLTITLTALFLLFPNSYANRPINENVDLEKSIAVLPFTNLSNDPEQQFFADGVMEDILTQLQRMGELKVTSKTSMEQYRSTTKRVTDIGDELDVRYLLEGSVRKSDNQIMITAQLIRTGDDSHMWADNFTSEYTTNGLFEIQRQIAENIVHELSLKISPIEIKQITQTQTNNKEAYEHFQKGRQLYNLYNRTSNELAIKQLELAIQKDPKYAAAYGQLASAFIQKQIRYGGTDSLEDSAKVVAKKGLELDSLCAECYKGLAFATAIEGKQKLALNYYEKAISISPSHSTALNNARTQYFATGNIEKAMATVNKLKIVDPQNFIFNIGGIYRSLGEDKAALPYFLKVVEAQNDVDNLANLKYTYFNLGQLDNFQKASKAMFELSRDSITYHTDWINGLWNAKEYEKLIAYYESTPSDRFFDLFGMLTTIVTDSYTKIGVPQKGKFLCQQKIEDFSTEFSDPNNVEHVGRMADFSALNSVCGEKEIALKWMGRAINNNFLQHSFADTSFDNIRNEPRFKDLIKLQEKKRKEALVLMASYNFPKVEDL